MKKLIFTFLILNSFYLNISNAQLTQQWLSTYDGPTSHDDIAVAMVTDNAGNIYVTGRSESGMISGNDFVTIKYNSAGVEQWASRLDQGYDERPTAIGIDNSGHVYVTGQGFSPTTHIDYLTVKYNPNGDIAWVRTYNGTNNATDYPSAIAVDNSGNAYVTGSSEGIGTYLDIVTLKYDSSGSLIWTDRYNYSGSDFGNAIALDAAGNIYVAGSSDSTGEHQDIVAIKLNPNGGRDWVGRFTGSNHSIDLGNAIVVDASGNAYVTGQKDLLMCTMKFSGNGAPAWVDTYTGPSNSENYGYGIADDGTGNIYVTGYSRESTSIYDYTTIKYSSSGTEQWVRTYDANLQSYTIKNVLTLDATGNIYIAGPTGNVGSGSDYLMIKYDPAGTQKWVQRYDDSNNGDDQPAALSVDNSSNDVVITGSVFIANSDLVTIKYSQTIGITNISSVVPDKFSLYQNYPNPFNPSTVIRYGLKAGNFVSLRVFDITGKEISDLVDEKQNAGTYEVKFDGSTLSSGEYFYELDAGDYKATKSMVIIK
jgi:uncharacterized delta-60 repeat protein